MSQFSPRKKNRGEGGTSNFGQKEGRLFKGRLFERGCLFERGEGGLIEDLQLVSSYLFQSGLEAAPAILPSDRLSQNSKE